MTKISTLYDNVVTLIEGALASYTEIPNPFEPDQNANVFLAKGFGVEIGAAENTNRIAGPHLTIRRRIGVILIQQANFTGHGVEARKTQEKGLLEDHKTLVETFREDSSLGDTVATFDYESDDGINYDIGAKGRYLSILSTFQVEYFENLS